MSDYETILLEVDEADVAWLTFNRPEKRNALDITMVEDVRAALKSLAGEGRIRALVFRGAGGKAFISGADIAQLRERTHADALGRINSDLFREIERFPAPTIACLQGWALGGGCELA
ncbi:MAG TPA: enoyl-CoA hydratase, partial [Planctomycetes bacterium]|nr:enoyl-CoA hydratase [Planctomycetota bacterium]